MTEKLKYKRRIRKIGRSLYLLLPFEWAKEKKLKKNEEVIIEEFKDKLIIYK